MKKHLLACSLIFLILAIPSYAVRPLATEDSGTLGSGIWEIETGTTYNETKENDKDAEFAVSIKYGVLEMLDVGVEVPYLILNENVSGVGDAELSIKFNVFEESESLPAFSLSAGTTLTTGNEEEGLGSESSDTSATVVLSKTFGDKAVHFNIGYTTIGETEGSSVSYGAAIVFNFVEGANILGEIVGESVETDGETESVLDSLIGVNWELYDFLVADAGLTIGLSDLSPRNRATAGLTFSF